MHYEAIGILFLKQKLFLYPNLAWNFFADSNSHDFYRFSVQIRFLLRYLRQKKSVLQAIQQTAALALGPKLYDALPV